MTLIASVMLLATGEEQRHQLSAAAHRQLAKSAAQLGLYGGHAGAVPVPDRLVGKAGCGEPHHLPLPVRQLGKWSGAILQAEQSKPVHMALDDRLHQLKTRDLVGPEWARLEWAGRACATDQPPPAVAEEQLGFVPLSAGTHEPVVVVRPVEAVVGVVPAGDDKARAALHVQLGTHRIDADDVFVRSHPTGLAVVGRMSGGDQILADIVDHAAIAADDAGEQARQLHFDVLPGHPSQASQSIMHGYASLLVRGHTQYRDWVHP